MRNLLTAALLVIAIFTSLPTIAAAGNSIDSLISAPSSDSTAPILAPDSLLAFANLFIGSPYRYSGTCSTKGFDCSGFTSFVFRNFDISLPHSSRMQAQVGEHVAVDEALPGDLVIFTGRDASSKIPGHVGIISSIDENAGIEFIHSSTQAGVIVSSINSPYYDKRFLEIRRIIPTETE